MLIGRETVRLVLVGGGAAEVSASGVAVAVDVRTVLHSSSSSLTEAEGRAIIRISQVILDFICFASSTNFVCADVRGQRVYQGKVDELD